MLAGLESLSMLVSTTGLGYYSAPLTPPLRLAPPAGPYNRFTRDNHTTWVNGVFIQDTRDGGGGAPFPPHLSWGEGTFPPMLGGKPG